MKSYRAKGGTKGIGPAGPSTVRLQGPCCGIGKEGPPGCCCFPKIQALFAGWCCSTFPWGWEAWASFLWAGKSKMCLKASLPAGSQAVLGSVFASSRVKPLLDFGVCLLSTRAGDGRSYPQSHSSLITELRIKPESPNSSFSPISVPLSPLLCPLCQCFIMTGNCLPGLQEYVAWSHHFCSCLLAQRS